MLWEEQQDQELLTFYRRLIHLRRQTMGSWSKPRTSVLIDDERGLYVYRCAGHLVAVNNHAEGAVVACPGMALHLGTDDSVILAGDELHLPPFAGAVLVPHSG